MARVTIDTRQAEKCLTYLETRNVMKKGTITKQVRQSIGKVRRAVVQNLHFTSDPRQMRRAVQSTVYKRVIGGNVNILDPRKREGKSVTIRYARGGKSGRPRNRKVSQRTRQIDSYYGRDRAFLLRMINKGKNMRGHGRNKDFFDIADTKMKEAANEINSCIDNELQKTADQFK